MSNQPPTPSRSGVFQQSTDRRVDAFTESISFDRRLFAHDIAGSIAHAQMLANQEIISQTESQQIVDVLKEIKGEIERGDFEFRIELEDVHMHIEQALIDRIGDVGRKLHTGRSRNDQVSTDLRLWCRDAIDRLLQSVHNLQKAFVGRCAAGSRNNPAGLYPFATGPAGSRAPLLVGVHGEA